MRKWQVEAANDAYKAELAKNASVIENLEIENAKLDAEADRQEVRILELKSQIERAEVVTARTMSVTKAPEPALCFDGAVALTAVAQMLEHRAENMAIQVGADAAEYGRLCERAHLLRSIVRQIGPLAPNMEQNATELFELLASRF